MARTLDSIKELLAQKFSLERKRLKSYGTPTDSVQMANVTAQHVRALMSESRYKEIKGVLKTIEKEYGDDFEKSKLMKYLRERKRVTKRMAKAIQNMADTNDKNRPWKRKVEKHKRTKK